MPCAFARARRVTRRCGRHTCDWGQQGEGVGMGPKARVWRASPRLTSSYVSDRARSRTICSWPRMRRRSPPAPVTRASMVDWGGKGEVGGTKY